MNGASSKRVLGIGLLVGSILLLPNQASLSFAEEPAAPTTQEVVAAIKRRAQQILEERRKARRLRFSGEVSQGISYEKNPANAAERNGDWYSEESLYLSLSKKLTPTLSWQTSYSGSFDKYFEYGDGTYTSQTLTPVKLTWQPGRMWRADAGVDLGDTWYPSSGPSNYREIKPSIGLRQNLWGRWFHAVRYEWFVRHYISKRARDGAGLDTLTPREDTRHRFRYELGTTWKEALLKVKQEWYFHDSNDARQDFYDAQDYKLTASVNRPITKKLSANASYSYELKNYLHRQVSGITAESRYDDTQIWTISGTYDFNKTWSIGSSFSHTSLNSNDPTGDYVDWTATTSLTAHF
ncbi:MAG: outer membrane beta-barrel protein [Candidatus Omnitrophica bacterium]|nr:outer membrane beta-barrel protein [Candidatus Omnitrophota bacterium]